MRHRGEGTVLLKTKTFGVNGMCEYYGEHGANKTTQRGCCGGVNLGQAAQKYARSVTHAGRAARAENQTRKQKRRGVTTPAQRATIGP